MSVWNILQSIPVLALCWFRGGMGFSSQIASNQADAPLREQVASKTHFWSGRRLSGLVLLAMCEESLDYQLLSDKKNNTHVKRIPFPIVQMSLRPSKSLMTSSRPSRGRSK